MSGNISCQHYRINNQDCCCENCGEEMVRQTIEAETVLSAPNAAAGTGMYFPDIRRQRTVVVGYNVTYKCRRCDGDRTVSLGEPIKWDCGQSHRGDRLPANA